MRFVSSIFQSCSIFNVAFVAIISVSQVLDSELNCSNLVRQCCKGNSSCVGFDFLSFNSIQSSNVRDAISFSFLAISNNNLCVYFTINGSFSACSRHFSGSPIIRDGTVWSILDLLLLLVFFVHGIKVIYSNSFYCLSRIESTPAGIHFRSQSIFLTLIITHF